MLFKSFYLVRNVCWACDALQFHTWELPSVTSPKQRSLAITGLAQVTFRTGDYFRLFSWQGMAYGGVLQPDKWYFCWLYKGFSPCPVFWWLTVNWSRRRRTVKVVSVNHQAVQCNSGVKENWDLDWYQDKDSSVWCNLVLWYFPHRQGQNKPFCYS